jgi:hypothetical protein
MDPQHCYLSYLYTVSKNYNLRPPERLTLLSWNIDGLDKHNLRLRTKAVCK